MVTLSVLIPTIPERVDMFTKLYNEVQRQVLYCKTVHPTLGDVQVVVDGSKKFLDGGLSIGKKREELVKRAIGKYLCFLDDDETVSPDYIEQLLRGCQGDVDIFSFSAFVNLSQYWMVVIMGMGYENQQGRPGIIFRKPWHTCPVKSIYAKLYDFTDQNYGEDWAWMEQVLQHCKKENHTDAILLSYNHGAHSEADKITQHVQSEQ